MPPRTPPSSADIADLKRRVEDLEHRADAQDQEIASLDGRVAALEAGEPEPVPPEPEPGPEPIPPTTEPEPIPEPGPITPNNGALSPAPPNVTITPGRIQPTGITRLAATAEQLTNAWAASQGGDEIVIAAGARIVVDTLQFAPRASGGIVIVRGDVAAATKRRTATERASLPTISAKATGNPLLSSAHGASGLAFYDVALTVEPGAAQVNDLIRLGSGDETNASQYPTRFHVDGSIIYAPLDTHMRRGIRADARDCSVVRSRIEDITSPAVGGFDSQALAFLGGGGNWLVDDCALSASSECVMFGGWNAGYACTPGHVSFKRCHIYKKPEWYGTKRVKNWVESKNGECVSFDSCLFEHTYSGEQSYGVILFSADQGEGGPWTHTADFSFRNCRFRDASGFVNLTATGDPRPYELAALARVLFDNCLVEPIRGGDGGGTVAGIMQEDIRDVVFNRCTILSPEYSLTWVASERKQTQRFALLGCVLGDGWGGTLRSPDGTGAAAVPIYAPDGDFTGSMAIDPSMTPMPAGMLPSAVDKGAAGMGADYGVPGVGCDVAALTAALAGVDA